MDLNKYLKPWIFQLQTQGVKSVAGSMSDENLPANTFTWFMLQQQEGNTGPGTCKDMCGTHCSQGG